MIRIFLSALVLPILLAIVWHGVPPWVLILAFLLGLAGAAAPLLRGQSSLKCPYCRKRVKLGATVCHHCGRSAAVR